MFRNSPPSHAASDTDFDAISLEPAQSDEPSGREQASRAGAGCTKRKDREPFARQADCPADDASLPAVQISPPDAVRRHSMRLRSFVAELVQATGHDKVEYRFRGPMHLLVAYEQGERRDGETFVEGLPRSTRRDLARRLTFVPAGHEYHEWHELRSSARLMYFYFDPTELPIRSGSDAPGMSFSPRLFFEDPTLWTTVLKLRRLLETPTLENRPYFEALGAVLGQELVRLYQGADRIEMQARGGLAAWQQRIVTAYIDEHLADQISLATMAQLARLSPYHFCRAFKQSFGVPPHRYHTIRRIERAKTLLEKRPVSVTDIGLTLGFSETSSFTAAFRRATGLTPSGYHRSLV